MVFGMGKKNKKATQGESSTPSAPKQFNGDEGLTSAQKTVFNTLAGHPTPVTKFLHSETLRDLGLYDQTMQFLTKVGLERYMNMMPNTYRAYTLEFLATLSITGSGRNEMVNFRLHKVWHSITFEEVRTILRVTKPPSPISSPPTSLNDVWCALTGRTHQTHNDKLSDITHPPLRILTRLISCLFFSMGEPTKVNDSVRECIWAMLPEGEGVPDWARLFVKSCLKHKERRGGNINCGGLVTLFLIHFLGTLPEHQEIMWGNNKYDLAGLVETHMLTIVNDHPLQCKWLSVGGNPYMVLPRAHLPSGPRVRDFFCPPDWDVTAPPPPQERAKVRRRLNPPPIVNVNPPPTVHVLDEEEETQEYNRHESAPHIQDTPMYDAGTSSTTHYEPWQQKFLDYFEEARPTLQAMGGHMKMTQEWQAQQGPRLETLDQWRITSLEHERLVTAAEENQRKMMEEMQQRQQASIAWQTTQDANWAKQQEMWREQNEWREQATHHFGLQNQRYEEYLEDSYQDSRTQEDTLGIVESLFGMTLSANPSIQPSITQDEVQARHVRARGERERRERRRRSKGTFEHGGSSGSQHD